MLTLTRCAFDQFTVVNVREVLSRLTAAGGHSSKFLPDTNGIAIFTVTAPDGRLASFTV